MLISPLADSYYVTFMQAIRFMSGSSLSVEIGRISEEMRYDPGIIRDHEEILQNVRILIDEYRFNGEAENIFAALGQMQMILVRIQKDEGQRLRDEEQKAAIAQISANPNFGLF